MDAKSLIARFGGLKNKQTKWFRVWSDCARYCLPNASPLRVITGKTTAGQSKQQPLDVSGIGAATKLASWLYSSTVYQGEEWFSLKARRIDGEDEHDFEIEEWLQRASAAVLDTINPSNFIQVYQKMLRGYVVFGTTVLYSEFNDKKELVCKSWDISDGIYIGEDKNGEIDTVFREFEYSARQAAQAFGLENLHAEIQRAANDPAQQDRKFKFIHCVFPRADADKTKKLPKYKEFASVYVDIANEKIVEDGGTDTFPYCVPRFYNTGEVYGRSPAMSAIPALRTLNMATFQYVENMRASGKPVAFVPVSIADDVDLEPGAVNPYDSSDGQVILWSKAGDISGTLNFIERIKTDIGEIFYNDVFQYLEDRKNMTATEAQLRYDEMIQGISPVLANLQNDLFKRFINRIVVFLCESGKIKVPSRFVDKNGNRKLPVFDVVYTSRLDTKIKGVQNADILNFLSMIGQVSQVVASNPQIAARVDLDKACELIAKNCNVAGFELLLPQKIVQQNLEAQAQQMQQAQMQGMVKPIDLQAAPVSGSAMDKMINGA